jgi:hypothetical protein
MPELADQGGRRDGDNGTLGMGQAVAAHLGKGQPPQRAPATSAHNQHIVRAAGQVDQHPAHRPAFDMRLYPRIVRNLTPHCHQRVPELLTGQVPARVSQFARRPDPVGTVTAWQFPGDNRDQDRIERAGQALPVTQCMQAARRAARPDEHPAYAEHRSAAFLLDPAWQDICSHLLPREACSPQGLTAPTAGTTRTPNGSGLTRAGMVISSAPPARNSAACRHRAADAIAGAAGLATGELSAAAPLIVIRKPPSTSPKIMNIADQASRLTCLDPRRR